MIPRNDAEGKCREVFPAQYPPTVIVVHQREHRAKCSVEPLRGSPNFHFLDYPSKEPFYQPHYVRLAMKGPLLSASDKERGLLVLDATSRLPEKWKRASPTSSRAASLPGRRPTRRISKMNHDPGGGLATIEAIFVAYHLLERETAGLLDAYYWRDLFLKRIAQF